MNELKDFLEKKLPHKNTDNTVNISDKEKNANFDEWIGESVIIDVLYHGSVHDFDSFSLERSHYGSYIGKGFYFSSAIEDVNANYASLGGGDLQSKIYFLDDEAKDLMSSYKQDKDDIESYVHKLLNNPESKISSFEFDDLTEIEQKEIVKNQLIKELFGQSKDDFTPAIYPVFVKLENPFYADNLEFIEDVSALDELIDIMIANEDIAKYIKEKSIEKYDFKEAIKETINNHISLYYGKGDCIVFDSGVSIAEDGDYSGLIDEDDEQEYIAEIIEKAFKRAIKDEYNNEFLYNDEPQGTYMDITNELIKLLKEKGIDVPEEIDIIKGTLISHSAPLNYQIYSDIIKESNIGESLLGNAHLLHGVNKKQNIEISDLLGQCIQRLGYDGFIMDAGEQFSEMKGVYKGETMHYIVFKPTQIKSAIGNNGIFNQNDSRFAFKIESHNINQSILRLNQWEDKTNNIIELFEKEFPSVKGKILTYKDVKDVPKNLIAELDKTDGLASGIFDRKNNSTAIFLFNIKNEKHLESVIAHEVIGHLGVKNVLGGAYDDYLISAYNFYDKKNELKELKHRYHKSFNTGCNYEYKKMIAEEKIAETIEKYGVNKIPFYKTIIGNIKNKLRKVLPSLNIPITNSDINYLISRSYSYFKEEPKLKKTNRLKM